MVPTNRKLAVFYMDDKKTWRLGLLYLLFSVSIIIPYISFHLNFPYSLENLQFSTCKKYQLESLYNLLYLPFQIPHGNRINATHFGRNRMSILCSINSHRSL